MGSDSQSLWASALAKLDDTDKNLLIIDPNDNDPKYLNVIDSLRQTTNDAYETCVRKRWQIKLPGKQEKIVVRDLLVKITGWLEVFKTVGDQAMAYDPGHAALPWAGVRFLLQITINDFKQFDFVVEGAAKITRITARYKLIECLYLQRSSAATALLEQAVVRLYTSVLNYLVQAKRYFKQRTGGRTDFQDPLEKMNTEEREADRCADLVKMEMANATADQFANLSSGMNNIALLRDALDRMEKPILQTAHRLERVEDHLDNMQRRNILDWLSTQPYHDHHTDIQAKVLTGTCQWVVQHPEFSKWQNDNKNSLLWLHGIQGSGKSCLTSTAIDEIMKTSETSDMHALAYFYCSRSTAEPQRANPQSILACIARQLSRQSQTQPIAPPTLALYNKLHSMDGSRGIPSITDLSCLIRELTEVYDRSMIVVDALDECDQNTRCELVEVLKSIIESASLVKVFVSSREEGDLRLSLQTHSGLQVTSLKNEDDIQKFVEFETDRLVAKKQLLAYIRKKETKEELTGLIKKDVTCKANGMFRWAELQLQSLKGIRAEKDVRSELSRIPRDLSTLYQDLYDRALKTTRETDQLVFQHTLKWMLSAKKRLTQRDFFLAVSAFTGFEIDDLNEEFILDLLSNFVVSSTTEQGDRFFRFAHLSVREFLEHMPEYSTEWTNTFAAEVTLFSLICTSDTPSSKEFIHKLGDIPLGIVPLSRIRSSGNDIRGYSLKFWSEHCVLAGEKNRSADSLKLRKLLHFFLLEYLDDNRQLNCWAPALRFWRTESLEKIKKIYQSSGDRAFLLACVYGFNEIVHITLSSHNLDQSVKKQGAMIAFQRGHTSIADLLIGSQGDAQLREYVLHHMGNIRELYRLEDPGLVRWLVNFFKPAQITEDMIIETLKLNDPETLGILLDYNSNLHITEEMILKSLNNPEMVAVLSARVPNILSTSTILMTTIRYQSMNTKLLVNLIRRCDPAVITCDAIIDAARQAGSIEQQEQALPVFLLLLERAGHIHVNHRDASLAFQWDCTGEVTSILLDHGWPVTPALVLHAATQGKAAAFRQILEAAGGSCQITHNLLVAAAENHHQDGKEILEHLVSQLNQPINDESWVSMIATCARPDSLQIILDMKPHLQVPESALLSIALNSYVHVEHFGVILNDGRELQITDSVVRWAPRNLHPEIASQLLDRHGVKSVTEHMLISAVSNEKFGGEMTRALMHRKVPVEVPSAKVIDAAIKNTYSGLEALEVLEEYLGPLEYTDKHVESVALGSAKMMKIVFDRRSITQIPESMLYEAARRGTFDGVDFLLQLDNTIVTREILIAAAGNENCGAEILRLLWDRNPEIEPCIEMFLEAARAQFENCRPETLRFLMDRSVDVKFGQQLLEAATTGTSIDPFTCHILVNGLLDSPIPVQVTREIAASVRTNHPGSYLWRVLAPYAMARDL